jgi:RNA polymerase sigma-70 factor, ECF subfamily
LSFNRQDLDSFYRYALSLTRKEEWAYDLVSHGVEKVLSRPFVLNKKAYAKRCIRNKFFDEYQRKEEAVAFIDEEVSLDDLEKTAINKDLIQKVLKVLNPEERELLYLWAMEDYSLSEIASLTKTPRGTLSSRLARLKKKLKSTNWEETHE